jgi:hypothetical protein
VKKAPVKKAPVRKKNKGGNNDKKQATSPQKKIKRTDALTQYQIKKYILNHHDMMHLPLIPGLAGPQQRTTVTEFNPKNHKTILLGGQKYRKGSY